MHIAGMRNTKLWFENLKERCDLVDIYEYVDGRKVLKRL
jgi:hypothetical protein